MDKERLEVIKEMFIVQNMKSLNGYGLFKLDDVLWLINKVEGCLNKEKKDSVPTLKELMSNTHHIPPLEELMSRITSFNQHEEIWPDANRVSVKVKILQSPDVVVQPNNNNTSFDFVAVRDVIIEPGETKLVPTGLSVSLPLGYELQVRPLFDVTYKTKLRVHPCYYQSGEAIHLVVDNIAPLYFDYSGLTLKGAAYLLDGSKITDEDYIHGTYIIKKGDKIAKGAIVPTVKADFVFVEK